MQTVYLSLREDLRLNIDLEVVNEISEYLDNITNQKYSKFLSIKALIPDHDVLTHQIPEGWQRT